MRPTKKGISLSLEQFEVLLAVSSAVTAALEAKDLGFSHDLSSKCAHHPPHCDCTSGTYPLLSSLTRL